MDEHKGSKSYLEASGRALSGLSAHAAAIDRIIDRLAETLRGGGKIMTCGNGGSAAEAMHLSEELMGRYRRDRPPLAAVCLNADAAALTCIANDWQFAEVFARQVRGLGRPGDALVVLSTSGRSPNVVRALEAARSRGVATVGLLGPPGSDAESHCDIALTVAADLPSSHVQEIHIVAIHAILHALDDSFPP